MVSTCAKVLTKVGAAHFFVLYRAGGWLEMDPRMADGEAFLARVEAVVDPVLEAHGLQLVDLQWRREARRWALRFFVDKPGGAGILDCQRLSHEAADVLDVSGLITESYDLEVSSPGLDRELKSDREFAWAIGKRFASTPNPQANPPVRVPRREVRREADLPGRRIEDAEEVPGE